MNKEYRKISELKNWDKNPRAIKKEDFERLKKQVKELGEYKPLLITSDGIVLGGNMRLKAYQDMGMDKVWVSVVDPKTEAEKVKYALSDNDRAGYYVDQELAELITEYGAKINLEDYKVDLGQAISLADVLNQFGPDVEEDEAPAVAEGEPDSKLGEVYQLGRHRLICGDATKIEDVEKLMDGVKADMFIGDPPYGMRLDTNYSGMHGMHRGKNHKSVIGDGDDFDAKTVMPLIEYIPKQIWFGADYYASSLGDTEHTGSWAVWDKRVEESQDAGFGSTFELFWSKEKHKRMIYRFQWAGFFTQGEKRNFDHPTEKSVRLISKIMQDYGKDDVNILDLFGGSGSTLIACEQTNRTCYMMELDPKYCDVIRKRFDNFVNKK